jgi:hypothetical protein
MLRLRPASYWLLGLLLDLEDGDNTSLRNISELVPDYTAPHQRR